MKKIKMQHNNRDRVICVTNDGFHEFFYQPDATNQRIWLFKTKNFSGSVFAFFRKYGRNLKDVGFSMTLKEVYEADNDISPKVRKIFDRLPAYINYVLREKQERQMRALNVTKARHYMIDDYTVYAA